MTGRLEELCKELSCPVCLDLFTSPVIELQCGHNYCRKCIKQTLDAQKCNKTNAQFVCPMCRKVFALGPKGFNGMKRNMFAENVVEKIKVELAKEEAEDLEASMAHMCQEHEEEISLICLEDNSLICPSCKLFGKHSTHPVGRKSAVYEERKAAFVRAMQSLHSQQEANARTVQQLDQQKADLCRTSKDIEGFLLKIRDAMVWQVHAKTSEMITCIKRDCTDRCKGLQQGIEELQVPEQVHSELARHLAASSGAVDFLLEERALHQKAVAALRSSGGGLPAAARQVQPLSLARYVRPLLGSLEGAALGAHKSSLLARVASDLRAERSSSSGGGVGVGGGGAERGDLVHHGRLDAALARIGARLTKRQCQKVIGVNWEVKDSPGEEEEEEKKKTGAPPTPTGAPPTSTGAPPTSRATPPTTPAAKVKAC